MEALRNRTNISNFGAKALEPQKRIIRKPLRGVENKSRNVPVKASFKAKIKTTDKENVSQVPKILKEKKEVVVPEAKEDNKVLETITPQFLQSLPEVEESHSTKQLPENVENIDGEDSANPQLVSIYVKDIYAYLRKLETIYPIRKTHLQLQPEITGKMRAVLVDWLVQVHQRFHLLQETLYMTVSILDRYLQVDYIKRSELQLVGITAMFIASKYEEMYAPEIGDFVYIADNTYSKQDIFRMERMMLRKLDFNLSKPLSLHFLRRNSKAGYVDSTTHTLAKYLMEVGLPEYEMAHIQPSLLAAAALYLSLKLLTELSWSDTLKYYSNYSEEELAPVVKAISKVIVKAESSKLQAIHAKYASSKFFKISTISQLKSPVVKKLAGV